MREEAEKLDVLGHNGEALMVAPEKREATHPDIIQLLTEKFSREVELITKATPDRSMQEILKNIAKREMGANILIEPQAELKGICIAFNNGWNACQIAFPEGEDSEPQGYRISLRQWEKAEIGARKILGYPLSDLTALALDAALNDIGEEGVMHGITTETLEELMLITFRDGWNAARSQINL